MNKLQEIIYRRGHFKQHKDAADYTHLTVC